MRPRSRSRRSPLAAPASGRRAVLANERGCNNGGRRCVGRMRLQRGAERQPSAMSGDALSASLTGSCRADEQLTKNARCDANASLLHAQWGRGGALPRLQHAWAETGVALQGRLTGVLGLRTRAAGSSGRARALAGPATKEPRRWKSSRRSRPSPIKALPAARFARLGALPPCHPP